ncbi:hypothetical protein [Mycobacterium sp. 1245805.9]|nr:hypothetical protein [Mycobacterium sp. 1245805.9]
MAASPALFGHWCCARVLASMPLRIWRADEVTPLSPHPNDPAGHSR